MLRCLLSALLIASNLSLSAEGSHARVFNWPVIGAPVASYAPETSWGFGVSGAGYFRFLSDSVLRRTSEISFDGEYTLNRQWFVSVGGTLYLTDRWQVTFHTGYRYFPDRFYGLTGCGIPPSDPERYNSSQFTLYAQPLCRVGQHWHVGAALDIRYEDRGLLPDRRWLMAGLGAVVMYDTRDNIYYPHHGMFLKVQAHCRESLLGINGTSGKGSDAGAFTSGHFAVDYRYFADVYKGLILAFQVYGELTACPMAMHTGVSGYTPLAVLLPALGGQDLLRGIYRGRLRDEAVYALQAEVRFPLYGILRGTVFASMGDAVSIHNPQAAVPKAGYGLGLRLQFNSAGINIRADVARNSLDRRWDTLSSYAFYLTVKEAF